MDGSDDGGAAEDASGGEAWPDAGLPDPPTEWAPPFPVEGPAEGFCAAFPGRAASADVWAHGARAHVVVDTINDTPGWPSGSALHVHDGERWDLWRRQEHPPDASGDSSVVGFDSLAVWLWGGDCWLRRMEGPREESCVSSPYGSIGPVLDLHMVEERRGWALTRRRDDYENAGVIGFDREEFFGSDALRTEREPLAVWGDRAGWFALVPSALFANLGGPPPGPRDDVPSGPYATLWATSRDDLWVSTEAGELLHFDGVSWERRASVGVSPAHLWSRSEERLYFGAARSFGVWTAEGGVERLASWALPELTLEAMDGDGSAVYLLLTDRRHSTEECGDVFVVAYDGEAFRRL